MFKWIDPKKQKNNIANYSTIESEEKTECVRSPGAFTGLF